MTINGMNIFMGVYTERMTANSQKSSGKIQLNVPQQEIEKAMKEIQALRGDCDTVTISAEAWEQAKAFLCSDAVYENMQGVQQDMMNYCVDNAMRQQELQQTNPDDPFWGNTGNQWLVFSEHLYNNGYYDGMSDSDVKSVETILDQITQGMDGLSRVLYNTGIDYNVSTDQVSTGKFNMLTESEELYMDLTSSVEALRYFAGNHIEDGELRESFNQLIDQYAAHNTRILDGYQSGSEKMKQFTNEVFSGKYPNSAILKGYGQQVLEENADKVESAKYLGGITHTTEEMEAVQDEYALLFQQLKEDRESWERIWKGIEEAFTNHTTKNSDKESIRTSVLEQANSTFERMKGYWSLLLN